MKSVRKDIQAYKQELHKEIDKIFDMDNNLSTIDNINSSTEIITLNDFRKRSDHFHKTYYTLTRELSDLIYENDPMVTYENKKIFYRNKTDANTIKYDSKMMPLLETVNMLTTPGSREYNEFSTSLSDSIKFLFSCYSLLMCIRLPKFIKSIDDVRMVAPPMIEFKHILDSLADDLVQIFQNANIKHQFKLPLTMLYCSELQDQVIITVANNLASERLAVKITKDYLQEKIRTGQLNKLLDNLEAIPDSFMEKYAPEQKQKTYQQLFKIMVDLFMSNFSAHLRESPIKPIEMTTETKMQMIDLKNSFIKELQLEFDRVIR